MCTHICGHVGVEANGCQQVSVLLALHLGRILASLGSHLAPRILLYIPSTRIRDSCHAYYGPHTYMVSSAEHLPNP